MVTTKKQNVFFILLVLLDLVVYDSSKAQALTTMRISENGAALAGIALPSSPSDQLREVAEKLKKCLGQVTGASFIISDEAKPFQDETAMKAKIWIGNTKMASQWNLDLSDLDNDGYVIFFKDKSEVIIVGPTDWGTEFGVYSFLEDYVGVRWLMPGPEGTHIPDIQTLEIETKNQRQSPVFFSRHFFGLKNETVNLWARYNRLHSRIEFHHNMSRLFPPSEIREAHPEFLPKKEGSGELPGDNEHSYWQPCFMESGTVDFSANKIISYFEKYPNKNSYSLGLNDGAWKYRCENTPSLFRINYLGMKHWSEIYFKWANSVVERVLSKYPNKQFGCLAYNNLAEPPSGMDVHYSIIPYITSDRLKWIDAERQHKEKVMHLYWKSRAVSLGWYDYIYGTPYLIPRVYFHLMAENYRYAAKKGVVGMTAEAYPNWGEGPKLYLVLKLWWNPELDVDFVLSEWYRLAVGSAASEYLAAYFELWESFWINRVPKTSWFSDATRPPLPFYSPKYLEVITYDDLKKAETLITIVLSKAKTDKQKARAEILYKAFEYYKASVIAYLGLVKKEYLPDTDITYYENYNSKRKTLIDEFENDPVLSHPIRFDVDSLTRLQFDLY